MNHPTLSLLTLAMARTKMCPRERDQDSTSGSDEETRDERDAARAKARAELSTSESNDSDQSDSYLSSSGSSQGEQTIQSSENTPALEYTSSSGMSRPSSVSEPESPRFLFPFPVDVMEIHEMFQHPPGSDAWRSELIMQERLSSRGEGLFNTPPLRLQFRLYIGWIHLNRFLS